LPNIEVCWKGSKRLPICVSQPTIWQALPNEYVLHLLTSCDITATTITHSKSFVEDQRALLQPGDLVLATGSYRARSLVKQDPVSLREVDIPQYDQVADAFKKGAMVYIVICRISRDDVIAALERLGPTAPPHSNTANHMGKSPLLLRSPEQLRSSFNEADERALPTTLRPGMSPYPAHLNSASSNHPSPMRNVVHGAPHKNYANSSGYIPPHGGGNPHENYGKHHKQQQVAAHGSSNLQSPSEMSLPCGPPRSVTEEWIPYLGSSTANKNPFLATFTPSHNAAMMSVSCWKL
jgi:hypothetical protein